MKRRILLVEDDADFREVFTHALRQALAPERLDVAFVEAGSLAEARARLREGGLDAALIDVTMAAITETAEAIKRLTGAGRSEV
jgi:CheY-like chemotaxis protein